MATTQRLVEYYEFIMAKGGRLWTLPGKEGGLNATEGWLFSKVTLKWSVSVY